MHPVLLRTAAAAVLRALAAWCEPRRRPQRVPRLCVRAGKAGAVRGAARGVGAGALHERNGLLLVPLSLWAPAPAASRCRCPVAGEARRHTLHCQWRRASFFPVDDCYSVTCKSPWVESPVGLIGVYHGPRDSNPEASSWLQLPSLSVCTRFPEQALTSTTPTRSEVSPPVLATRSLRVHLAGCVGQQAAPAVGKCGGRTAARSGGGGGGGGRGGRGGSPEPSATAHSRRQLLALCRLARVFRATRIDSPAQRRRRRRPDAAGQLLPRHSQPHPARPLPGGGRPWRHPVHAGGQPEGPAAAAWVSRLPPAAGSAAGTPQPHARPCRQLACCPTVPPPQLNRCSSWLQVGRSQGWRLPHRQQQPGT